MCMHVLCVCVLNKERVDEEEKTCTIHLEISKQHIIKNTIECIATILHVL